MAVVRGYMRSSTDDQKLTIEAQEADIREWCERHGHDLVQLEGDPGVSGSRRIEACRGLQAILDELKAGEMLVVVKRDRLSRKMLKQFVIEEDVEAIGASVHSIDGTGNGDTDADWAQRVLQAFFAEYEARQIRSRTRRAARQKKANGSRWGQVPYGWALDETGPRNENGSPSNVIEDPHQQAIIESMRLMRSREYSLREIAAYLNGEGEPAANGGSWTHQSVSSVLKRAEKIEA